MVSPKTVELINKEIDGVLTPAESKRLKECLTNDSEAANFHREMKTMAGMLAGVKHTEPSPNLKKMVLNSISKNKYRQQHAAFESQSFIRRQLNFKLGFSFALGIFVGVLTYSFIKGSGGIDRSELLGTIGMEETNKNFVVVDSWNLEGRPTTGEISTETNGNLVLLNIDLTNDGTVEFEILFDESDLVFTGFHPYKYGEGQITVGESKLMVVGTSPKKFVMFFKDKTPLSSAFEVSVFTEGSTSKAVLRTSSQINKKN